MYIKELEADNFKSFASGVSIPFRKGFTTIGGPNGSGKSNIIDSILFALGLANARSLRMEQLSDFICTITKKNEAFVQVVLGAENENEEDLTIGRKIRKTSQGYNSIYYLNGKVSTQTEILIKLEKYRITPNSFNVVMQSDVMSIVNCTNGKRREIIDDIAGIGDFNRRIDKAKDELQIVEERVEKANIVLEEIAVTIERLTAEKETAIKYQKLKDEKAEYENRAAAVKYFDLKRNLELAHQNILEFNKKKKEEEAELAKLEKGIAEIKARYEEAEALVKNNGEAEQLETKKRLEEIKGLISGKNFALDAVDKNIHNNLKTVENSKNGIEKYKEKIKDYELKIEEKKAEILKTEENIKAEEAELAKILEEASGLKEGADKQLEERNNLKNQLEKLKEEEWNIKSDALPLETDLKLAQQEILNAEKTLENLINFKNNYSGAKDKLTLQLEQLSKETEDFKHARQNAVYELDKTKNELTDLIYDIQAAQKKLITLEAQKQAAAEASLGRSVDAVMKSGINGVHAPLMQLGSVKEEYSEALEAAMGGRMKNIAVDDEYTAKQCIDYLKTARAGIASFLPMNKMKKAPSSLKLPKEKGVIDYAVNLLDFDDKYLDVFYHALGETLVMEDYASAAKLIGKYRIVTLDGSLFEKSGMITGGDRRSSGLKFTQNQDEELEKYKKKFFELQAKRKSLDEKCRMLEDKQDKIRTDYSNSMTELNRVKIELNNLNNNAKDNETKILEAEKAVKENKPKIQNIEKKLEKTEEKLVNLNDEMLKLQDKIAEIESKMPEDELKKLKEMTSGIESRISRLKDYISKSNNDILNFGRDITFNQDLIKTNERQIQTLYKDNENLENDKKQYTEDIKVFEEKAQKLEEEIKTLGEKLSELQSRRDVLRNELLEAETKRNKSENEVNKIGEQVEAFKSRRRELEPQLLEAEEELKNSGTDIKTLAPEEISLEELNNKIQRLTKRMQEMEPVNMLAIEAYEERKARQEEIQGQVLTLTNERRELLNKMDGYEQVKKETFLKTYNNINDNFKEVFSILTEGEGSLELDNPENPFEGGLTIKAQIRDKTKQKLSAMSGGEKSLTALAFVFAIQKYLPAPFYALDEVDASLDDINVSKLADMIKNQSKNTQFIVVSHRQDVLKLSDRTIGVTQKEKGRTLVTGISN